MIGGKPNDVRPLTNVQRVKSGAAIGGILGAGASHLAHQMQQADMVLKIREARNANDAAKTTALMEQAQKHQGALGKQVAIGAGIGAGGTVGAIEAVLLYTFLRKRRAQRLAQKKLQAQAEEETRHRNKTNWKRTLRKLFLRGAAQEPIHQAPQPKIMVPLLPNQGVHVHNPPRLRQKEKVSAERTNVPRPQENHVNGFRVKSDRSLLETAMGLDLKVLDLAERKHNAPSEWNRMPSGTRGNRLGYASKRIIQRFEALWEKSGSKEIPYEFIETQARSHRIPPTVLVLKLFSEIEDLYITGTPGWVRGEIRSALKEYKRSIKKRY